NVGLPAAFTISTTRSARSLPSGPATMPHASSGWSRLACATMRSYVAWSMVCMALKAYGRTSPHEPRRLLTGQPVGDPLPHRPRHLRHRVHRVPAYVLRLVVGHVRVALDVGAGEREVEVRRAVAVDVHHAGVGARRGEPV